MTTFFISSSSRPDIRERTLSLADTLKQLGWQWHNGHCWADNFETAEDLAESADLQRRIDANIEGAMYCDVFIMIDDPSIVSRGSNIEFGARLTRGESKLFIIGGKACAEYLFYLVPWAVLVEDEEELMEHIHE